MIYVGMVFVCMIVCIYDDCVFMYTCGGRGT